MFLYPNQIFFNSEEISAGKFILDPKSFGLCEIKEPLLSWLSGLGVGSFYDGIHYPAAVPCQLRR